MNIFPNLSIENSHSGVIAGIDEAGRGPLAGPVVASAVILDINNIPDGLNDSKKLTAKKREILFDEIYKSAQVRVGIATVSEIDEINILNATFLAMQRAVTALPSLPDIALIDGNRISKTFPCKCECIVKGDTKSLSIASASIIAKVTRDRIMQKLAEAHPHYGWHKNAGYGTKEHLQAIDKHGITDEHRRTFSPIKQMVLI